MGVQGLWELLAPVGRRVSVETLAGKKLAIDASIWLVQFMKAMRDEKGEMVRNAHLLGFFRRICKLLFLRTKPVFVFDGGTPALKRRTVIARRRQRENAQAKIRKTAEKLLLNHLKSLRLKELANDIENQRRMNDSKGKKVVSEKTEVPNDHPEDDGRTLRGYDQEMLDEMLAASIAAEEEGALAKGTSTSNAVQSEEDDENVEIILPEITGEVDPALLDALPPDLLAQMRGRSTAKNLNIQQADRGKNILLSDSEGKEAVSRNHEQEKLDAMLAASILVEEGGSLFNNASTSSATALSDEEDNDADEEMIVLEMQGIVDRDVLDSLPISMRLDLFAQMKERQMAENRQKYQEVKKAPEKFSELQIQSYLKAVALRREINQVQKAAAGIGVGGVRTSRIASEANKEFIFSSSFTGNKKVLASAGVQKNKDGQNPEQRENPSSSSLGTFPSTSKSKTASELAPDKYKKALDDGVQTFLDERGHIRVSRVRAMGIRMTRDLQRNLDLMKEIEQDQAPSESHTSGLARNKSSSEASDNGNGKSVDLNERNEPSMFGNESSIQISFEDDGDINVPDGDEELFAHLVGGSSLKVSSSDKIPCAAESLETASDVDWEEGQVDRISEDGKVETKSVHDSGCIGDESEVEWEEGVSTSPKENLFSSKASSDKPASKGSLEEDAELQEAIRRSLEDKRFSVMSSKDETQQSYGVNSREHILLSASQKTVDGQHTLPEDITESGSEAKDDAVKSNSADGTNILEREESCGILEGSSVQLSKEDTDENGNLPESELLSCTSLPTEPDTANLNAQDLLNVSSERGGAPASADGPVMIIPNIYYQTSAEMHNTKAVLSHLTTERTNLEAQLLGSSASGNDVNVKQTADGNHRDDFLGKLQSAEEFVVETNGDAQFDITKSSLEEEMRKLSQECIDLGNEQKKLERNAESINREMFTECQELLQMFGLPYIIAPMEAEAQCAYLELTNLVDGVVTDDSDVFLFGARSVYKNIFDDRKYVETYFMKDIEKELGLSREKLIRIAMLLGSDYTEGISGIGIVNAIEVLNAFPEEDGLQKFREWIESPDASILGKVDRRAGSTPRKRGARGSKGDTEGNPAKDENDSQSDFDNVQELKQYFMEKHRNVSKNWHIPPSFPSEAVVSAYSTPRVDKSAEPFLWGKPDIFILRKLCWEKFGWNSQKADELLLPVLNEYNKHETQLRLEAFYTFNERFAKIRSKRIKKAVKGISGRQSSELMDDAVEVNSKNKKKRRGNAGELEQHKLEKPSDVSEEVVAGNRSNTTRRSMQGQSRKRKASGQPVNSEGNSLETPKLAESSQGANKRSHGNKRDRGGGRSWRTRGGSRTGDPASGISEGSSGDDNSDDNELKVCDEKLEGMQDVRRSGRNRKAVNYVENLEDDESTRPFLKDDEADIGQGRQGGDDGPSEDDYLRTGGGFCVGDGKTNADLDGSGSPPAESPLRKDEENSQNLESTDKFNGGNIDAVQVTADGFHDPVTASSPAVQHNLESSNSTSTGTLCKVNVCEDKTKDDPHISSGGALSAMPFLKRKRKKT
ncbi:DNA repair protein UVH3 isoform X1 [Punica granatum]|uniref:DNA repair protein UVH3 isoform X1 n=1 Tax=Punica granatum TaxID=22663 RepID=A0A6P8CFP0_PUNGR|nr:DNA repair protein UVH3 isoform X1 [Punica granatum]